MGRLSKKTVELVKLRREIEILLEEIEHRVFGEEDEKKLAMLKDSIREVLKQGDKNHDR